jgi:putative peptidoglycan lipid II flippase
LNQHSRHQGFSWLNDKKGGGRVRGALLITVLASLLAKSLGFVRLQQIAATLGASVHSDTLLIAMQVVWLLETVLISGAVAPMIVSRIYHVEERHGGEAAVTFFLHAGLVCAAIAAMFMMFFLFLADKLAVAIAPGLDVAGHEILKNLLRLSAATPLFLVLAHFLALLNRLLDNGAWYSIPQIVTNATAILGLYIGCALFDVTVGAYYMIVGLSIGALMVCFIQFWAIPPSPRERLVSAVADRPWRVLTVEGRWSFWRGVGVLSLLALVSELYVWVDFYFAAQMGAGNISLLGFASRIASLTNVLIVGSAFVVLEPRWAKATADFGSQAWQTVVRPDTVSLLTVMSLPVAVIYTFPGEITSVLYNSHAFSSEARQQIETLTQIFAFGLVGLSLDLITLRAVIIARQHRWLVVICAALLPIKVVLNYLVAEKHGVVGLAVVTVLITFLQATGNALILARSKIRLGFRLRDIIVVALSFLLLAVAAKTFFLSFGGGVAGLLVSCLFLTLILLAIAQAAKLNFTASFFKHRS